MVPTVLRSTTQVEVMTRELSDAYAVKSGEAEPENTCSVPDRAPD